MTRTLTLAVFSILLMSKLLDNFLNGFKKAGNLFIEKGTNALENWAPIKLAAGVDYKSAYQGGAAQDLEDWKRGQELFVKNESKYGAVPGAFKGNVLDQSQGLMGKMVSAKDNYRAIGYNDRQRESMMSAAMGAIAEGGAVAKGAREFIHVTTKQNADDIMRAGFDVTKRSTHFYPGGAEVASPKVMGNSLNASNDPKIIAGFKNFMKDPVEMKVTLTPDAKVVRASSDYLLPNAAHTYPDLFLKNSDEAISKFVREKLGADAVLSPDPMEGLAVYNMAKAKITPMFQNVSDDVAKAVNTYYRGSRTPYDANKVAGQMDVSLDRKTALGYVSSLQKGVGELQEFKVLDSAKVLTWEKLDPSVKKLIAGKYYERASAAAKEQAMRQGYDIVDMVPSGYGKPKGVGWGVEGATENVKGMNFVHKQGERGLEQIIVNPKVIVDVKSVPKDDAGSASLKTIIGLGGAATGIMAAPMASKKLIGILQKVIPGNTITIDRKSYYTDPTKFQQYRGEVTMYNPTPGQTDSSPTIMASGKKIYDGAIATSDYNMPFGTRVYIPELDKEFIVEDRMNRRYEPQKYGSTVFDILHTKTDSKAIEEAKRFGRQKLTFVIVGHDGRKTGTQER